MHEDRDGSEEENGPFEALFQSMNRDGSRVRADDLAQEDETEAAQHETFWPEYIFTRRTFLK